jgi:hypothetical protein
MSIISTDQTLKSVFGEQVTVQPTPLIQISNQYGLDPSLRDDLETFEATGGSADSNGNVFRCQTGTSVGGYGVIRSKEVAVYRAGQGVEARFTAAFTSGVALSLQLAGLFSLTETAAFGYDGADFGILHEYDGAAEVQRLSMTATPSGGETATITLDGDAFTTSLTNSDLATNAFEIEAAAKADGTINAKWRIEQEGDDVVFISKSVGNKTGTMSFSSSTATATLTEAAAGAAKSSLNVAQASWNITTTPFVGFDETMLNLYRIEYGYLGAVSMVFSIYNPSTGFFVPVHRQEWANSYSTPIFGNPDMKIGWTSASLGASGTNLTVTGASAYVAVAGENVFRNQSYADTNTVASVGGTFTPLITIKNRITLGEKFNLGKIAVIEISVENEHTKSSTVEIIINGTLTGVCNFQLVDNVNSIALIDKASTGISGGRIVSSFQVASNGEKTEDLSKFFIELLPEDTLTVAAAANTGTASNINVSINWIEEK